MRFDPRLNLSHYDPKFRGHAAAMLKHSFDERDGDMLVRAAIMETDVASFVWISDIVMCKWMVKLENALYCSEEWPMADNCTVWFAIKAEGWEYPSYERFLPQHLDGDNWLYKFAAFIYCRQKLICLNKMKQACSDLLAALDNRSVDWQAVATSSNLKSKRRMRSMIENIANEWDLMSPPDLLSVPPSAADIAPCTGSEAINVNLTALPTTAAPPDVAETIKITSVRVAEGTKHEHIVSLRWTNTRTGQSGEMSRELLVAWLRTPGRRAVVVDGLHVADVRVVGTELRHVQAYRDEEWIESLLHLPRY